MSPATMVAITATDVAEIAEGAFSAGQERDLGWSNGRFLAFLKLNTGIQVF